MTNDADRTRMAAALEAERERLFALLSQFSEQQWHTTAREDGWTAHDVVNHLADATYGLSLALLGEGAGLPVNQQTGQLAPNDLNEQRRQKNRDLPREKIMSRLNSAFATTSRAIDSIDDYTAPAPSGLQATKSQLLQRIIDHSAAHRSELAAMITTDNG